MSVKPIVLLKFPSTTSLDELMASIERVKETVGEDYYVMACESGDDYNNMEVFYEKDFTDVKYEELKKIFEDSFKNKEK